MPFQSASHAASQPYSLLTAHSSITCLGPRNPWGREGSSWVSPCINFLGSPQKAEVVLGWWVSV